ncbi:MAG: ABC transporter ATP-binding protein [Ktedonobacterales bacterium]
MGFIFDGLDAEGYDRNYSDRALLSRILGYFLPERRAMLLVAATITLASVADTVLPVLISHGIDALLLPGSVRSTIILIIVAILIAGALSWTFNFIRRYYTARAVGNVVMKIRQDAFDAVLARDMSFYDETPSGKVVSRVTSDTEDFATVVTLTLNLLSQIFLVVLIFGVLFYINVGLTLLALTIVPVIVFVALAFRRIARRTTQHARRALARVNNTVQETISGISIAKNFRQEQTIYREFKDVNKQSYQVTLRQGLIFTGIFPLLNTIAGIGTVIVLYFGGLDVLDKSILPGSWYLFIQAIGILWFPLTGIASFWSQFQLGLGASERIFALIDAEPRIVQHSRRSPARVMGRIEFREVDFGYISATPVLHGFNLTIPAGQTVAVVGHTGAGKSTLAKLVARFYEFQGGQLLIDDQDIRSFDLWSYHRQLGIVPQVPFLFSGTVADNIRYARPDASDQAVEEVALHIGGGDWLEALPDGLQTEVGETGRSLSMGQRQLVALARVLLQDPSIIILDEATASIDPLTEAQIQEGLDLVLRDRTAILIAHRLSTVKNSDRILVMQQGKIVEEGTHDGLLEQGGHYAHLYNTYFRSQSSTYRPGEGYVPVKLTSAEIEELDRLAEAARVAAGEV